MPAPDIRPARTQDAPALAALSAQLGYPSDAEAMRERLAAVTDATEHAVYVCCDGGAPVAWIHVMRTLHLESGFGAEIAGLIVADSHRGHGIGARLVRHAADWARAQGCARLRVRSRAERAGAHAFYRRLGFEQEKVQHVFGCPL